MLSDITNEKLDNYGKRYGVSKSSIVGFVLGQWLDQTERTNDAIYGVTGKDGFLMDLLKEISDKADLK